MDPSAFSLKRPQLTLVLFAMAAVLGLSALRSIPLGEDPQFPISTFAVVAVYPGAQPIDIEQLVVDPLEKRFNEMDDLKSVKTNIEAGVAVLTVEFESTTDPEKKYDTIVREVNALRPKLPQDLYRLDVQKFSLNNVNIAQIGLVSDVRPYRELEDEARRLADRMERVAGVKTVERMGYPKREVDVELDPGRLAQLHLPPASVLQAIQGESANIPGGSADAGRRRFDVKTSGSYRSVEEVRNTIVAGDGRAVVTVGDVGRVQWGREDLHHIARYNGHRAVWVTANMKPGQRISDVKSSLWKELDRSEKLLPAGIAMVRPFDQSANVDHRLSRLIEDFVLAILLVLVTLVPLGWRASVVVMISIPLSLAIGVAVLQWTGFSINQLSIVGFVIALGLLVDDSIVVVENIERFLRGGLSRDEAAHRATRQITVAVLGCTATLIAAFIPIFMLPGTPGKYISSLPAAVVYTILASLVVSLTLVPLMASRILSPHQRPEGNAALQLFHKVIDRTYGRWLHRALAAPRRTLLLAGLLFAASLALVPAIGLSLFPKADTPQFLVRVTTPAGSSLAETDRAMREVERELQALPQVRDVLANTGHGNPFIYYNVSSENERANFGEAFVLLREYDPKRTPAMLDSLQGRCDRIANARIEVKVFENGPPLDAPIAMRIAGEDLDTLRVLAGRMQDLLQKTPGTWNVVNPLQLQTTSVRVHTDERKAGLYGVPTVEVDRAVRMALAGFDAGSVREADGQDRNIRVRFAQPQGAVAGMDGSRPLVALDRVYVPSLTGRAVPLRQIADVRLETALPVIQHYNRERSVSVDANVRTGYNTDKVTKVVLAQLAHWQLPAGYRVIPAGEIESREESFGGLNQAIILTVFIILAILIMEFGTFRSTLIVASVIPLGIVGGLVALFLMHATLSFTAMIGFIALIGIEIKNSILLVDFTNQLREVEGLSVHDAVEKAGRIRFLPIVLTTLTAVGGLTPLVLQNSSLYSPLAGVIIGGLISSTLLARLVTPVMYQLLAPTVKHKPKAESGPPLFAGEAHA